MTGKTDIAVHSLKDLPTESPEGLTVAAVLERSVPTVRKRLEEVARACKKELS